VSRIVISIEGGIVSEVVSDNDLDQVVIVDFDAPGRIEEDIVKIYGCDAVVYEETMRCDKYDVQEAFDKAGVR